VQKIAGLVADGKLDPADITPQQIGARLDTAGIPDPDLLVRTSGERRLSNFLLWQCAYTEFVFVDELWPDFTGATLRAALDEYASRERRFGGLAADAGA
jgi:undecaprenyl diphosphate synthase